MGDLYTNIMNREGRLCQAGYNVESILNVSGAGNWLTNSVSRHIHNLCGQRHGWGQDLVWRKSWLLQNADKVVRSPMTIIRPSGSEKTDEIICKIPWCHLDLPVCEQNGNLYCGTSSNSEKLSSRLPYSSPILVWCTAGCYHPETSSTQFYHVGLEALGALRLKLCLWYAINSQKKWIPADQLH